MGEAVEQGGGHLGIAEDRGPFAEAEVGCDDDACALVKLAQQVEEQRPTLGAEGQVAQFIKDHHVELGQAFCDLPSLALGLFLFEGVDQFDRREESDLTAMMRDGLDAMGRRDMGLSGARTADQDDTLGSVHELATVQGPDSGFIDLAGGEVEAREVLVGREACGLHVIGDGSDLAFGQFGLQQL